MTPDFPYLHWFYHLGHDALYCAPRKCGSTSLHHAVCRYAGRRAGALTGARKCDGVAFMTTAEAAEFFLNHGGPAIQFVRHPIERFESLWRNKCRDGHRGAGAVKGMTPDELLNFIVAHPTRNNHWVPQYKYSFPGASLAPVEMMGTFFDIPERANATSGEVPVYSATKLLDHYAEDLKLWKRARDGD